MAWRMKLKLPKFKLTQIGETTSHRSVPRGRKEANSHPGSQFTLSPPPTYDGATDEKADFHLEPPELMDGSQIGAGVSLHAIKQKASVAAWDKVRTTLRRAAVESSALPINQSCILCSDPATHRCTQCGASAYYCASCFSQAHSLTNVFHVGEVWKDGVFRPIEITDRVIDVRPPHSCPSSFSIPLYCLDENGYEHNILLMCCPCEPVVATMVRARLWPAAPQRPHLAFTFELLDWAEALLLECQVPLKDLCKAVYFKCPHLVVKRKGYYSSMIDAFEEYRCMKVELRHVSFVTGVDSGNVCPACPKESGTVVLSMDALFGLPRKKSSGRSYRDAIHGHYFFHDQSAVDEFVFSAPRRKNKALKMCNDFLAGDTLRSSQRYQALDETAVFGTACRHEFPFKFINLKHGERLSYGVWLLQEIVEQQPENIKIQLMYDIACNLVRHLKVNGNTELLQRVDFSIPTFHAYCHIPACQILYSPRRCDGLGLSDGEVMERLWSYLRRFSRMTKEMRPAHRIDVLAHALLYYGFMTKKKLAQLLVRRYKKAKGLQDIAIKTYARLISTSPVPVTEQVVEQWIQEEKAVICTTGQKTNFSLVYSFVSIVATEWRLHYFKLLRLYYATRGNLISSGGTAQNVLALKEKLFNMDNQLIELEIRHSIVRWQQSDPDYISAKVENAIESQQLIYTSLRVAIVKRLFLLKLKAKYADGQKIAKRLSSSINKETDRARQLLDDYNTVSSEISASFSAIPLTDVLSPEAEIWERLAPSLLDTNPSSTAVPFSLKKDISDAHFLLKRCEEELQLLTAEMHNALGYWVKCVDYIKQNIETVRSDSSQYSRGVASLLQQRLWVIELTHSKAQSAFRNILSGYSSCNAPYDLHESDFSDSDTDTSDED